MLGIVASSGSGAAPPPPPPPNYGPELVVNGIFTTDTASWSSGTGATLSVVSGQLKILSAGSNATAQQTVSGLTIGALYRFAAEMAPSQANRASIALGGATSAGLNYATTGSPSLTFTAEFTSLTITLYAADSQWADAGQHALFDNVSVRQIL